MKHVKTGVLAIVILVVAFVAFTMCSYTVKPNETAIVLRLGKAKYTVEDQGLHFKAPFVESVTKIYTGDNLYDIPTSDVITSDKKSMIADDVVVWQVTDPLTYYRTLTGVQARAEERIEANVYNATKNIISSMTQDEIIAARGNTLTKLITDESNSDISQYGIEIKSAEIKALDLPDDNKTAVYERMISERNNIAAAYTAKGAADAQKIKNETDKQVSITTATAKSDAAKIEAEGEAQYMSILSGAYNDPGKAEFYNYQRSLDAIKAMAGENKTIILDKNSELARILYGN
ncbi:MAG: protease modulator HflC [Pseudobutyrivibrio sp.]|nr:protease modulator HflC [Pseudobutyrivibrio sp.]